MGLYINPKDTTKEKWLIANGKRISTPMFHKEDGKVVVCLVDNGLFTAAAIAYSAKELDAFRYTDGRPKTWYHVPEEKLRPFLHGQEIL